MEIPTGTQCHFSKGLLLSASVLSLWIPQGSWATLHIQKIPERPQKNQDLLLSVQGIPDTFQDIIWYQGKETDGGTRLFSYIPDLQRPQRDGSAMRQRDIVGFPNGSMLLRHIQPSDSDTYHVEITVNPSWTMRAKTEVQVAEKLPVSTGTVAAIITGSLAAGTIFIGIIAYLLATRGRKGRNHRMATTGNPELGPSHTSVGDDNIYEVMPSPVLLVSPLSDMGSMNAATPPPLPLPPPQPSQQMPEDHQYQDLLNPDPAPYCQLVPSS